MVARPPNPVHWALGSRSVVLSRGSKGSTLRKRDEEKFVGLFPQRARALDARVAVHILGRGVRG